MEQVTKPVMVDMATLLKIRGEENQQRPILDGDSAADRACLFHGHLGNSVGRSSSARPHHERPVLCWHISNAVHIPGV